MTTENPASLSYEHADLALRTGEVKVKILALLLGYCYHPAPLQREASCRMSYCQVTWGLSRLRAEGTHSEM